MIELSNASIARQQEQDRALARLLLDTALRTRIPSTLLKRHGLTRAAFCAAIERGIAAGTIEIAVQDNFGHVCLLNAEGAV